VWNWCEIRILCLSYPFLWDKTPIHWVVKWLLQSGGKVVVSSSGVEKFQRSSVISQKNRYLSHGPRASRKPAMLCRCIEVHFISETSWPIPIQFPYCECIKTWWGDFILPISETKHIVSRTVYLFFLELRSLHFNIIFFLNVCSYGRCLTCHCRRLNPAFRVHVGLLIVPSVRVRYKNF
jgi:hypothetical protein